jgi:hypothetical protein
MKKWNKKLLPFLLLVLIPLLAQAETNSLRFADSYKDPFLAGVLSWVMPGAGQIYCHSYTKGSIFIFGDMTEKTSMVLVLLYLNNKYFRTRSAPISWELLEINDRAIVLSYFLLSSTFKLYNAMDAVFTAKKYNRMRSANRIGFLLDVPGETGRSDWGGSLTWTERF